MNLNQMTMQELRSMLHQVRSDMQALDTQLEEKRIIEQAYWNEMDRLAVEYGQLRESMAILSSVTLGDARRIREWVN